MRRSTGKWPRSRAFVSVFAPRPNNIYLLLQLLALFALAAVSDAWIQRTSPSADRVLRSSINSSLRGPNQCSGSRHETLVLAMVQVKAETKSENINKEFESASTATTTAEGASNSTSYPLRSSSLPAPVVSKASAATSWEELERALDLLGITWNEWLSPLWQGLLPPENQNPSSWEEFWELSLKGSDRNNRNNRNKAGCTDSETDATVMVAEQFTRYLERLGATYVKFGQALSSRPDIVPRSLAVALSKLQDDMDVVDGGSVSLATADGARAVLRKEYTAATANPLTSSPFRDNDELEGFLSSLSETPVAAASIGVVYSGTLPDGRKVAVKVRRPGVEDAVRKDAKLLRRAAELVESIPSFRDGADAANVDGDTDRFVRTNVTGAVDEFMTRLEEELDYRREANNLELFGKLYSHKRTTKSEDGVDNLVNLPSDKDIRVVVPEVYRHLCTDKVLVMEWIDGIKLVDLQQTKSSPPQHNNEIEARTQEETMELIRQGIDCTLSQLLETGILHADPHGKYLAQHSRFPKIR